MKMITFGLSWGPPTTPRHTHGLHTNTHTDCTQTHKRIAHKHTHTHTPKDTTKKRGNPNGPRGPKDMQKQEETNPNGSRGPKDTQKQEETNPNVPRRLKDMQQQKETNPNEPRGWTDMKQHEETNLNGPRGPPNTKTHEETNPRGPRGPQNMKKQEETNPKEPRGPKDMKKQEETNPNGPRGPKDTQKQVCLSLSPSVCLLLTRAATRPSSVRGAWRKPLRASRRSCSARIRTSTSTRSQASVFAELQTLIHGFPTLPFRLVKRYVMRAGKLFVRRYKHGV